MRAVVDTNLLLRMAAAGRHFPLYQAWREKRFVLVTSLSMLDEFKRVIRYPRVRRFLSYGQGQGFVALLPSDDMVIATAVAARPCYLVTADRDLYDDSDLVTRTSRDRHIATALRKECILQEASLPPRFPLQLHRVPSRHRNPRALLIGHTDEVGAGEPGHHLGHVVEIDQVPLVHPDEVVWLQAHFQFSERVAHPEFVPGDSMHVHLAWRTRSIVFASRRSSKGFTT